MEIDQLRREDARWKILRVIDAGRPVGVNESIVGRVLSDLSLPMAQAELRRELDYLRDLGLIETGQVDGEWFATTTAAGVAVLEYTVDCPVGIARPARTVA